MSTDHETQAPTPRDPTAAERQRRCRARKRAERAAACPVTPAPVTVDEADGYPTQGTRWATVEVMYDDTDETVEAFAEAEDRCKADPTPDNVIAFEDARNRFYAGRWPPGRREPIRPTYYDVVTGELVA